MDHLDLDILPSIPQGIADITPERLGEVFAGPTLIELDEGHDHWVLVSLLLHGNETTGLDVLKKISDQLHLRKPAKNLALFIGNVEACTQGVRHP